MHLKSFCRGKESIMESAKEEGLYQKQLAFIGKILTGFTHKISKPMVRLHDSTGILCGLFEQMNHEKGESNNKFVYSILAIEKHINMFSQKIKCLNRFGLRFGTRLSAFAPIEVIEEAVIFSTRLAHLRNVSINLEINETLPDLYSNPVSIQFLVSILINYMLKQVSDGGEVSVNAGLAEKGMIMVKIEGHGALEAVASFDSCTANQNWALGHRLISELGGRLQPASIGHDTKQLFLFLPLR